MDAKEHGMRRGEQGLISEEHDIAANVRGVAPAIPAELREESGALFDDTRLDDIDPDKHAAFIIARVLDRGTLRSVAALLRYYGLDRVRDFFRRGGARQLSCRTLPLWRAYLNLSREECTPESSPQSRSPFWMD